MPDGLNVPALMLQMEYEHPKKVYGLLYPRYWHIVCAGGGTPRHASDGVRGDFVAQVTVAVWEKQPAGKHLSPEQFTEAIGRQEGWVPAKTLDTRELAGERGGWMCRVAEVAS